MESEMGDTEADDARMRETERSVEEPSDVGGGDVTSATEDEYVWSRVGDRFDVSIIAASPPRLRYPLRDQWPAARVRRKVCAWKLVCGA
jgi:hypothetical protein